MPELQTRPYTGVGDDTLPANVKALPDHAKAIWVAAFNSAWDSWSADKTDQPQDGYAFAVAWAAVKNLYKKDAEGNWTKRSLIEGDGHFTKVWRSADGVHRWRATVMDDGVDQYATRMTIEFQDDVCARAALEGAPWLGIAHFGRQSQVGETTRLYRDGRMVKAEGTFLTDSADATQASLARAAYETAAKEADLLPAHRTIAVSQAFYPEAQAIEDCGVVAFTRGRIEHIALTTRKANSRCDFGVEEGDEMRRSKSRRDLRLEDAAAIVGDDLARALDEADAEHRTVEQDGLLYRMYEVEDGDGSRIEVSPDGGETWQDAEVCVRAMVPTHKPPLNDPATAWNAAAARSSIWGWATDGEDFDAVKARQGFAIFDSDNPDNKTGMALPHHDIADGKLVTHQKGVMAAGGVTMGARGGIKEFQSGDNERAQTHLAVHYGQMDRTPPWKREESNLRHWAEAMEEAELLHGEEDLANARAFLRHRLDDGTIKRPTVAEAKAMFEKRTQGPGAALLRATGETDFATAIKAVVSDPDRVGSAPQAETREGRRVRAEKLAQVADAVKALTGAGKTIGEFIAWASENLRADSSGSEHRALSPDADFRAALTERYGAEPDASLLATMNQEALMQTVYQASYTFRDIVIANIQADPAEVSLEERLANVQNALNEFGQIIASIISQAAQPRSSEGTKGGTGEGVKPDGGGGAPVKPSGESDSEAQAAVSESLDQIRAALGAGVDAGEMQLLLDQLAHRMSQCIDVPPPSFEEALSPIMDRLQAIEDEIRSRSAGPERSTPDGLGAPPRRKGFRPRLDAPALRSADADRPTERGYSPEQFARGAHRRQAFNPYT